MSEIKKNFDVWIAYVESMRAVVDAEHLRVENASLRARIAELEAAIKDAPHEPMCETSLTDGACDCWKAEAFKEKSE